MSADSKRHSERTPQEILATGAAWITETELQLLVEQKETLERALKTIAFNARSFHKGDDGKARALDVIAGWAENPNLAPEGVGSPAHIPVLSFEETERIRRTPGRAGHPICGIVIGSSWHAPVACAFQEGHTGDHSWAEIPQFDPRIPNPATEPCPHCGFTGLYDGHVCESVRCGCGDPENCRYATAEEHGPAREPSDD